MSHLQEMAARALACLDLTEVSEECDAAAISDLCLRAQTRHGHVAAICILPRFVARAKAELSPIVRIATVVNFPAGEDSAEEVIDLTHQAIADGADEVDMVIPYLSFMEGKEEKVISRVERVKRAAGDAPVKAILETGVLESEPLIRRAAELVIQGGADFMATSTGRIRVNATPGAARIMLEVIAEKNAECGFKAAGGVKSAADAALYLAMADEIMGEGWATPAHFRIGASGALTALLATLDDAAAPKAAQG